MKHWKTISSGRRCWSSGVVRAFETMIRRHSTRRRSAMVMRAMLIGVLVIGAVAILETDANAWYHCFFWPCIELTPRELDKVVSEVAKYERSEVWLIGFTNRGPRSKSKEFDRVSRKMEDVRETLIQR